MHIRRKSRGRHRTIIRFRRTFPRGVIDRGKERELVEGTKLITHPWMANPFHRRRKGRRRCREENGKRCESGDPPPPPSSLGEGGGEKKRPGEEEKDATKTIIFDGEEPVREREPRINLNIDMTLPESRPRSTERR